MSDKRSQTESSKTSPQTSPWCSERISSLLSAALSQQVIDETMLAQGLELFEKKKVLDLLVVAGRASAKVQPITTPNEQLPPVRAAFGFPLFSETEWSAVMDILAEQPLFAARILGGELPAEVEEAFEKAGLQLFPSNLFELESFCDCGIEGGPGGRSCAHRIALSLALGKALDADPFSLFSVRGKGKEESLFELRRVRSAKRVSELAANEKSHEVSQGPLGPLGIDALGTLKKFWNANPEVFALSYTIRADDLPGSILRRLDPIPVGGLEGEVEFALDDGYAQIARRAQGLGLSFNARKLKTEESN